MRTTFIVIGAILVVIVLMVGGISGNIKAKSIEEVSVGFENDSEQELNFQIYLRGEFYAERIVIPHNLEDIVVKIPNNNPLKDLRVMVRDPQAGDIIASSNYTLPMNEKKGRLIARYDKFGRLWFGSVMADRSIQNW